MISGECKLDCPKKEKDPNSVPIKDQNEKCECKAGFIINKHFDNKCCKTCPSN